MNATTRILVIDDAAYVLKDIEITLLNSGFDVITAQNGVQGLKLLRTFPDTICAIVLDRVMPIMDGMELLNIIRSDEVLKLIPVIILTSLSSPKEIQEGIAAGAFYYIVKPYDRGTMVAIVTAAVDHYHQVRIMQETVRRADHVLDQLERGTFFCRTIDEATLLANTLAKGFPDPPNVVNGLMELLLNAVEHGNLGITYSEKTELLIANEWRSEVDRRLQLSQYKHKRVEVRFERRLSSVEVTIRDDGNGFNWVKYLDIDPERACDPNGRGIAMARLMSFDSMRYLGNGNTVHVVVSAPSPS